MKYMLLMYGAEGRLTDEERRTCLVESLAITHGLAARGKYVASAPLQSVAAAATVRVRGGATLVTDGPFAETYEQLGGYYILELAHLDEAIAVASKLPPARKGTVEIRPLLRLEGLPPARPLPRDAGEGSCRPFMVLCYDDDAAWRAAGPDARREAMAEAVSLAQDLDRAGRYVSAAPLHSVEMATCVRVRDGKRVITDGPFAETNEVLGGYYVILAESREEAVRIAARHPGTRFGAAEVRPLLNLAGRELSPAMSRGAVDPGTAHSTR